MDWPDSCWFWRVMWVSGRVFGRLLKGKEGCWRVVPQGRSGRCVSNRVFLLQQQSPRKVRVSWVRMRGAVFSNSQRPHLGPWDPLVLAAAALTLAFHFSASSNFSLLVPAIKVVVLPALSAGAAGGAAA